LLKNHSKIKILIPIIIILLSVQNLNITVKSDNINWDNDWEFSKEIQIPFDTSNDNSIFQPIDIEIEFENQCWAKNENEHSIRVLCLINNVWMELESQIYNLEFSDNEHISSCSLVFLIPENTNGLEKYYIFYDDTEKENPNYIDHVNIEESYYRYEPIPGYPLESSYYKIIDDEYISYSISLEGQFMGYNTCQHIYKMVDKAKEVIPKNGELFVGFDFKYSYDDGLFDYSSTSQKLVSKEILVNGNLMVECRITSLSKLNDLKTTALYKYYHCPGENSRIHAHVKHESLEEIKVYYDTNTDGTYASMQIGGVKSKTIEELNIGQILPFMHFINEMNSIEEFDLDLDPEYIPDDHDIRILYVLDDVDLGLIPWISFDEGDTGLSHSIIFESNSILSQGSNEKDGLQINAFQMDYPHLPGLENNIATIQISRNSYEKNNEQDLLIPKDFIAEFNAEFFTTKNDGYKIIQNEAEIFQKLVNIKPLTEEGFEDNTENNTKKLTLDVAVHLAPSIPLGSSLSALLGLNLSYINVEIYKNEEFRYSTNAVRLKMKTLDELDQLSFIQKIKAIITSFEWRNTTIFKIANFKDLDPGKYVVKVYLENPFILKERQYIGYKIIDLNDDTKTHIYLNDEERLEIKVVDQSNQNVQNAELKLKIENETISKSITDNNGESIIKVPWQKDPYNLIISNNNINIYHEQVKLNYFSRINPIKKTIEVELYDLSLNILDTWKLTPEIDFNPMLLYNENDLSITLNAEKLTNDKYYFSNIPLNNYQLYIKYKSFIIDEDIQLNADKEIQLEFPAEFNINLKIFDSRGLTYNDAEIIITRESKELIEHNSKSDSSFTLPPGTYKIEVLNDNDDLISSRNINVFSNKNFELITKQEPIYPLLVIIFSIILILISIIMYFKMNEKKYFYYILSIAFIIISIVLPWWSIYGYESNLETSTNMYLQPTELITITQSNDIITGETAYLPDIFKDAIGFIPIISIIGSLLLITNLFFINKNNKKLRISSLIIALIFFSGSLVLFLYSMITFCNISVGSLYGSGLLDISISGEETYLSINSSWGPSIGFYFYLISVIVIILPNLISQFIKMVRKR
jgi:hypothetical protein